MKTTKILFWTTTSIIFLFEGVLTALTFQSDMAKEGIKHLQYPYYFGSALVVFKVLGALVLMLPQIPTRIKEWAYAGFTFNFIFASISHGAIDGMESFQTYFPLLFIVILAISYFSYHKLHSNANSLKP